MNLRHIAVKREKYELYFILVLYTFIKVKSNKGKKKKETIISEPGNIFSQPIQRYFSLAGGQSYRRLVPFI